MANAIRLHQHLAQMVATERELGVLLDRLSRRSEAYPAASLLLSEIGQTSAMQLDALSKRLDEIGAIPNASSSALVQIDQTEAHPVTSALSTTASALNSAIVGYSMLRSIALRKRDSSLIGEGNTGDMAGEHTRTYAQALHRIYRMLHDAVLWELDADGEVCNCACPSCHHGICLCSQAPRRTLSDIWAEAGPISRDTCVFVNPPRPGSPAETAGLKTGDNLLEADGIALETHFVLQKVLGSHSSGEQVNLRVERASGDLENVVLIKS